MISYFMHNCKNIYKEKNKREEGTEILGSAVKTQTGSRDQDCKAPHHKLYK